MTAAAYWVQLLYVPWLAVTLVLYVVVLGFLDVTESVGWTSQGALGWALAIACAVVAAGPSWLGAWLAVRARRGGAGPAATVALWQNLIVGLAFTVFVLIDMM